MIYVIKINYAYEYIFFYLLQLVIKIYCDSFEFDDCEKFIFI